MKEPTPDFSLLIPELPDWNNGAGIDPEGWVGCMGNFQLAVGYSLIFWPRFVRSDGYVLREGYLEEALRAYEQQEGASRQSVEAVMNHLHIADMQHLGAEVSEAQLRYLGRVLKDIYETKLLRDFPRLQFTVLFDDRAGLDPFEYELTFFQTHHSTAS